MPLTGQPPTYTRGYSFTQHSIDQPNVPQPGDRLDQEFDDIATAINDGNAALQGILDPDGTLKDGIVGMTELAPGLFDQIVADAEDQIEPLVEDAETASNRAQQWAGAAQASAQAADIASTAALGAAVEANNAATASIQAADRAASEADAAQLEATFAGNSATTATNAMQQAEGWKDLSFQWAEYMAGPVDPAPPGWPEAVDDGRWSAKWWATRAQQIVGEWGNLYLGGFNEPPPPPPGQPYVPGTIYFDIDGQTLMVWNGSEWVPAVNPAPSLNSTFVYRAADEQSVFSGADVNGHAPSFTGSVPPCDVFVNGVRLTPPSAGATLADFTIDTSNPANPILTIGAPLEVDSIVQWDFLMLPADVVPVASGVTVVKLIDLDKDPATGQPGKFDGVTKTFQLRYSRPSDGITVPADVTNTATVLVVLDGATQSAVDDYTCAGASIVFSEAPLPGARFSGLWFQTGSPAAALAEAMP